MIYITGATGFIGERLARALLVRGEKIRCLVRSPRKAEALKKLGAELMQGDITDEQTHVDGMRGARLAFHLAAIYDIGIVDAAALARTNVLGTRAFLAAVRRSRIPRAVHVSTTAALPPRDGGDAEPRNAYMGPYPSEYHRTKAEAHRLAVAEQERGVPLIIVCPAYVYGPGDRGPGGRFVRDLARGRVPALLARPASFSYVHVDDVVSGLIAAGERGRVGEVYVLGGEAASMNDFAKRVAALAGRRSPVLRMPVALAKLTGTLLDAVARPSGWRFLITREGVATTSKLDWTHTYERAARDFGYQPRMLDHGLPETVAHAQTQHS